MKNNAEPADHLRTTCNHPGHIQETAEEALARVRFILGAKERVETDTLTKGDPA